MLKMVLKIKITTYFLKYDFMILAKFREKNLYF